MNKPREKQPRWFKFWKRSNEEQIKAIQALTEALKSLEQGREAGNREILALMQPERLGHLMASAMAAARAAPAELAALPGPPQPAPAFSPEVVQEAVDTVTRAVMGKMEQMQAHVAEAVRELPPSVVQQIAGKLERGEDFTLRRRHGCVHIDFGYGDEEFYLKL